MSSGQWNFIIDFFRQHYNDVTMGTMASQITSLTIVYSIVYSDADQRKHQSSASLAFVRGINRGPVNSLHKWPVTQKMFPFDDVIMVNSYDRCHICQRRSLIVMWVALDDHSVDACHMYMWQGLQWKVIHTKSEVLSTSYYIFERQCSVVMAWIKTTRWVSARKM